MGSACLCFRTAYFICVSNILVPANNSLQFGAGAGTRNFKKAVDRNRIKRLTREAWRLQKNVLTEKLAANNLAMSVFFIYTGKELPAL